MFADNFKGNLAFDKDKDGIPESLTKWELLRDAVIAKCDSMPNPVDITQKPDKRATPPEFAWWEFNIDDVTAGKGKFMSAITDATDPDLSRFLKRENGKLLLYHGWADPEGQAEPTLDYFKAVVDKTFGGNIAAAREKLRLFM